MIDPFQKSRAEKRKQQSLDTATVWSSVIITIVMVAYIIFIQ